MDFTRYLHVHTLLLNPFHQIAPKFKHQMMEQGTLLLSYQPLKTTHGDLVNFFRLVVGNFKHTDQDMDDVMDEIEALILKST